VLDPGGTPAYVTRNHALMVYDTLFGVDDKFTPHPQMVDTSIVEDDGKLWRMTLRPGLMFHDNTPVTAKDVVASIKRWGGLDRVGKVMMQNVADIVAVDAKTVEFRLSKPFPMLADALGKVASYSPVIMPERHAVLPPTSPLPEIIGSGPYRYVAKERVAGSLNVYAKFEGYVPRSEPVNYLSGGKIAYFDRVEWHTIPDAATAAAALQAGEVDWWEQPTPDLIPMFAGNDIKVEVKDLGGNHGLLRFNHLQPPFDNPAIRKVLLNAIKQSDFMLGVAGDDTHLWKVPLGFFQPGSPMASTAGLETFVQDHNLEKVKADLIAAGYKGERVVMLSTADFPSIKAMCEISADLFRKVGINIDVQTQDWATVSSRFASKESLDKGGWSVTCNFTSGLGTTNPIAHTYLRCNGAGAFNGWPNIPEIEALRVQWQNTPDVAAQAAICAKMQAVALEMVPYVPLGLFYSPTAYRSDLTGMLNAIPLFYEIRRA
jgi:peptide/nickel transport system substrate-binding protein